MENIVWAKTLLITYKFYERVCGAIDKLVDKEAVNSSYSYSAYIDSNSCFNLANKLLDYTERKIALINAKLLIESALMSIDRTSARLLIKKYIDQKKNEAIIDEMGMSRRTYFRKMQEAISSFSLAVLRLGYPAKKLEKHFKSQKWIFDVYDDILAQSSATNSVKENPDYFTKFNFLQKSNNAYSNVSLFN